MKNYNPFIQSGFISAPCFLSGDVANDAIRVWPKEWIESYLGTHNKVKFLDDTEVPFDNFRLPCNSTIRKNIEKQDALIIEEIEKKGLHACKDEDLFRYLSKVFYGYLFHEVRTVEMTEGGEAQIDEGIYRRMRSFFNLMQAAQYGYKFEGFVPFSIFRFQVEGDEKSQFAFRDDIRTFTFTLRVNNEAILVALMDHESTMNAFKNEYALSKDLVLTEIQFAEWEAMVYYSTFINQAQVHYKLEGDKLICTEHLFSRERIYQGWDNRVFSEVLAKLWAPLGIPKKDIFHEPDEVISYLPQE